MNVNTDGMAKAPLLAKGQHAEVCLFEKLVSFSSRTSGRHFNYVPLDIGMLD